VFLLSSLINSLPLQFHPITFRTLKDNSLDREFFMSYMTFPPKSLQSILH